MPSRALSVTPRADQDVLEIFVILAAVSPAVAARFEAAVRSEYARPQAFAYLGRAREFRHRELRGLRSCQLTGFPSWLIFYRVRQSTVEIVRVLHGARDLPRALRS